MNQGERLLFSSYLKFDRKYLEKCYTTFSSEYFIDQEFIKINKIDTIFSIEEINKIYLPILKIIILYINLNLSKSKIFNDLFRIKRFSTPYIIGITGSVAVGKSTTSHLLQILLTHFLECNRVDIIKTDDFLYPNCILKKKNIIKKKGFPQSYDMVGLIKCILDIKSGVKKVFIPTYSKFNYDIIPGKKQIISKPDILILEGLNILQINSSCFFGKKNIFISDFVDFSIYIDASEKLLEQWYINRFLKFSTMDFIDSCGYFYKYSKLKEKTIINTARMIWKKINRVNLKRNIIPTKKRARLIIQKGSDHLVKNIRLRK